MWCVYHRPPQTVTVGTGRSYRVGYSSVSVDIRAAALPSSDEWETLSLVCPANVVRTAFHVASSSPAGRPVPQLTGPCSIHPQCRAAGALISFLPINDSEPVCHRVTRLHWPMLAQHVAQPRGVSVLTQLKLVNFRSFRNFTISFGEGAYLVGPNNAGKSTILTALRTADVLIRIAHRRNPTLRCQHNGRAFWAYPLILNEFPALQESVRYEFHDGNEALFELTWSSGARLVAVWPKVLDDDEILDNFFYLEKTPGLQPRNVVSVRTTFPSLGVIPILTPVEHAEPRLTDDYVIASISTRLSSRHFRNQLRLMRGNGEFRDFREYIRPWLDGIEITDFGSHADERHVSILDVYYRESGSNIPKELVWAGDGIQVWLQILYHIYRTRERETVILDEPEVYLHPDLQRKLVHLLEDTGRQTILATHSSEMAAEADPRLVMLVEKGIRRARRAREDSDLELLSTALGTAFNLRLARALRSRIVLFVEGQDMAILRRLAKTLGLTALATEHGVTVIPLEGYSRWGQVSPFAWLCRSLLPEAIKTFVVLDHDYRPEEVSKGVEDTFSAEGIVAHVWKRKELESYLVTPSVIARVSGSPSLEILEILDEITQSMEDDVFSQMLSERIRVEKSAKRHETTIMADFKKKFDSLWQGRQFRLDSCPPKRVISELNNKLKERGHKTLSMRSLATAHRPAEVPQEMVSVLRKVEDATVDQSIVRGRG